MQFLKHFLFQNKTIEYHHDVGNGSSVSIISSQLSDMLNSHKINSHAKKKIIRFHNPITIYSNIADLQNTNLALLYLGSIFRRLI